MQHLRKKQMAAWQTDQKSFTLRIQKWNVPQRRIKERYREKLTWTEEQTGGLSVAGGD